MLRRAMVGVVPRELRAAERGRERRQERLRAWIGFDELVIGIDRGVHRASVLDYQLRAGCQSIPSSVRACILCADSRPVR